MGDVAIAEPVVAALRFHHPELRITLLTRPKFAPFFRDIPDIEFLTPDLEGDHRGWKGICRLARQIVALRVDAMADFHGVMRTRLLGLLLRLKGRRVATIRKGRRGKRALTRKFRKIRVPLRPTIDRYGEVLARLGLPAGRLCAPEHRPRELSSTLRKLMGTGRKERIGVAPFAQHAGKVYPMILMDSLIGLLAERYGKIFIFGGGTQEAVFAAHMEERHKGVRSLIGQLTLDQELDLISNLDCMVTMDSVAMHMASLAGVPVVSVWGQTHPYAGFYGFGQDPASAVQHDLPCRPCSVYGNRRCMLRDYRCLAQIPPTEIFERVNRVIADHK